MLTTEEIAAILARAEKMDPGHLAELRRDLEAEFGAWDLPGMRQALLAHVDTIQAELDRLRASFDSERHSVLRSMGVSDIGHGWLWVKMENSERRNELDRLRSLVTAAHSALPPAWPNVGGECVGCGAPLFCTNDHAVPICWAETVADLLDEALYPEKKP